MAKKQKTNNKKKTQRGITLIALVITIIVLLILAGISISMLSGNNGIIQKTMDSKTYTERASMIEQTQADILGQIAENKGTNITKEQLSTILNKYFQTVASTSIPDNISTTNDIELTTIDEKYKINLSEIYKGSFVTTPAINIDKITSEGEYIGFLNDDEVVFKYENTYYIINIDNNNVADIVVENYFFISSGERGNQVIFYGNNIETWADFITSSYNSPYGWYAPGTVVAKDETFWLKRGSNFVNVNDSIISECIYHWGVN